ncbi:hypothetical protein BLNAU_24840 [Blattamonas nauphoetae]|uniref:Secreted protein n=1 Tax=Blattamonas nauphoetae TaxID=2049346 RepID=A0ABQ9WP69_9EUKA|nr:hypothetical protein BLNAU_24840 [Blattamonas nauphoetae]
MAKVAAVSCLAFHVLRFGQGTSFRIDRIAEQQRPTPIAPDVGEFMLRSKRTTHNLSLHNWPQSLLSPIWTCNVPSLHAHIENLPAFSNNLGYSLEGLARSFTPNGPNSKIVRYLHAFWEAGSNSTCRRQLNNTYNTASKQNQSNTHCRPPTPLLSAVSQSFLVSWPVMQRTLLKVDTRVILC